MKKKYPSLGTDEELADVMKRAEARGLPPIQVCFMLSAHGVDFVRGLLDDADREDA